jgi:drug/metabolite transporter (DMT)-like permease
MTFDVFAILILAALGHAVYNAVLKGSSDQAACFEAVFLTQAVASIPLLLLFGVPNLDCLPYLAGSALLGAAYIHFLRRAYSSGEFTQIYPLARGLAPLLVTALSFMLLGETIGIWGAVSVVLISLGIANLSLSRDSMGSRNVGPILWAVGASCFIALYSILDGVGARLSGSPHSYMALHALICSLLIYGSLRVATRCWRNPFRGTVGLVGAVAGLISYGGAWIVIWAMTQAPIPLVSALRETSVVFAIIIGIVAFKERVHLSRIISIVVTLIGTAMLKLGR